MSYCQGCADSERTIAALREQVSNLEENVHRRYVELKALRERNAVLMERNIQLAGSLKTTEDSRDRALERIAELEEQREGQEYT